MRPLDPADIAYLFVHTQGIPTDAADWHDQDAADIRRWHVHGLGWDEIGFHYVIIDDRHSEYPDGHVQEGRSTEYEGAHLLGANHMSLGICCIGNGDVRPFTDGQRRSLTRLCSELMDRYDVPLESVLGHREINALVERGLVDERYRTDKTCPGALVDTDEIRTRIALRRARPEIDLAGAPLYTDDRAEGLRRTLDPVADVAYELRRGAVRPEASELDAPIISYLGGGQWLLEQSYEYNTGGGTLRVPAGFVFDLASVPRLAWWLIAPFELSVTAPLVHDWLYGTAGQSAGSSRSYTRREADDLFRTIMRQEGVPLWRRWPAYLAVRWFGASHWGSDAPLASMPKAPVVVLNDRGEVGPRQS